MAKREEVMAALEFAAAEQKSSGLLETWFGNRAVCVSLCGRSSVKLSFKLF